MRSLICQSCQYHIRALRHIRSILNANTADRLNTLRWVPGSTTPTQSFMACQGPWPQSSSANKIRWPASSCKRIVEQCRTTVLMAQRLARRDWRSGGPRFKSHPRLTFQSWSSYQLNQLGSEAASDSTLNQLTTCGVSNTCTLLYFLLYCWVNFRTSLATSGIEDPV